MEHWQYIQINSLAKIINSNMIFADIGACRGEMLSFFSSSCKHGYAFEPDKENCNYIKNNFDMSKINLIEKVVSDVDGIVDFYNSSSHVGNILGHSMDYTPYTEKISVESVTLDHFFSDKQVDIIKIDVEGAEWKIFEGARNLLQNKNIIFQVEFHLDEHWHNKKILYDYGYEIYDLNMNKLKLDDKRIYQSIIMKG
jgi:FkbM family methyltransferase